MPMTRSAVRASSSAVAVPVWPMPPTSAGWSWRSEPLLGLGGGDGDAGGGGERGEGLLGGAVVDPAARHDQRSAGAPHRPYRPVEFVRIGGGAAYVPDALGEELLRPVVRLDLHVLGQRQCHGAGLRRVGQGPHRLEGGRDQGLGAGDPVEVAGDGAQAVVDGDVTREGDFELLEHGVCGPGREGVPGQQEDREVVDGGEGGAGDEVGGAGADGGGDGLRGEVGPTGGRSRRRRAPWPVRCGPGGRASRGPTRRAPGRCRRRCRGRRCPRWR